MFHTGRLPHLVQGPYVVFADVFVLWQFTRQ